MESELIFRHLKEEDYETICKWWKWWRWPVIPRGILPDEGKGGFVNDMKDKVMNHVNTQFEEAVVEYQKVVQLYKTHTPADANGEYGIKDQFLGLPVILSSKGVEKIVEVSLSDDEQNELNTSEFS